MTSFGGIDAGPSTGIAVLTVNPRGEFEWAVMQVNGELALSAISWVYDLFCPAAVGVEKFVVSNRAGTKGKDAEITRRIATHAYEAAYAIRREPPSMSFYRMAAEIKPWATDKRLEKTGFPMGTKFKDARDAGRHALYCACRDGKVRDPLY